MLSHAGSRRIAPAHDVQTLDPPARHRFRPFAAAPDPQRSVRRRQRLVPASWPPHTTQPRRRNQHDYQLPQRRRPSPHTVRALRNIDWPEALLFDCDGVLVETERVGHRVAFNEAFRRKGIPHEWSVDEYGRLLEIGGGKERMTSFFMEREHEEPFASLKEPDARKGLVAELHKLKTDIFMDMVEAGSMPLRPGVARLVGEARDNGVKIAVCSTSNERAVATIVRRLLGADVAAVMRVFAGDMVPKKKPDPAIYLMAAEELSVSPARCVVIEDSRIGLLAARAAGMRCIVTTSSYTVDEDFSTADAVFDCIGDAGDERFSLHDLTTPGSFWLNPPLAIDAWGNWYTRPTAPALDVDLAFDVDPP